MSKAIENLDAAYQRATAIRPKVGGVRTWPRLFAVGGRYAQSLVPARMSELVFDGAWTSCDHWRGVGLRHG
jgi:hypothetical protein